MAALSPFIGLDLNERKQQMHLDGFFATQVGMDENGWTLSTQQKSMTSIQKPSVVSWHWLIENKILLMDYENPQYIG